MTRLPVAAVLTALAVGCVAVARRAPGPLAAGVPYHRVQGPPDAKVSIVVFSDFQCPTCARAEPVLQELRARHSAEVRVYFRHYPLRMHKWAMEAARAAEAAGRQGKFFEYAALLFQRQKDWSGEAGPGARFLDYARELGLDVERLQRETADRRWDALILADGEAGRAASVRATPTIFIGEQRVVGAAQLQADGERLVAEASR